MNTTGNQLNKENIVYYEEPFEQTSIEYYGEPVEQREH